MGAMDALTPRKYLFEPPFTGTYEEIFLRPLSRRRFKTFWPSVVRIRTRKPCVLLRCRLLG